MFMQLEHFDNSGFDRGASLLKEALWCFVKVLFFASVFPIPSVVKVFLLRCFGARIGRRVVIRSQVNISFPWRLEMGDHVWIGDEVMILSLAQVTIQSNVCISQRAFLCTGSHNWRSESFELIAKPITLEESCWVAANVFIGPGVTLHKGTICSAGSVVLRDAGPSQILIGNPAVPHEIVL